jgi:hypothetical protein
MGIITSVNQSTFIKGTFILESVVTAHEILHSIVHEKEQGLVLMWGDPLGVGRSSRIHEICGGKQG